MRAGRWFGLVRAQPHPYIFVEVYPFHKEKEMNVSDLIKGVQQAGLIIERMIISSDGSVIVEFAPVSKARTMAVSATLHKRVGRPPKNGRRRRRGRLRKIQTA